MTRKGNIEKEIKIVTVQELSKDQRPPEGAQPPPDGSPWRDWKISVHGVNEQGQEYPLDFVDKVEFRLHPSFANHIRHIRNPPFTLAERGWGEFDMKIILHFVGNDVEPHEFDHDLNFRRPYNSVKHTLEFENPKLPFLKLLAPEKALDSQESSKSKPPKSKSRRSSVPDTKESRKRPKNSKASHLYSSPSSSSESSLSPDNRGKYDQENKVDYERLATNLYNLREDDILQVVEIVNENRTGDMYINEETEGEFHVDLYTLGEDLLRILWDFTQSRLASY